MEEIKRQRPLLALGADAPAAWRRDRASTPEHSARSSSEGDDDGTFSGSTEELEALMRGGPPPPRPRSRRRWRLGVSFLVVVGVSLALWGGLLLLLR